MMIEKNRCIIFEEGFTGHRSEYISHLMRFIIAHPVYHNQFIFILNEGIRKFISDLITSPHYHVHLLNLENKKVNSTRRGFAHWKSIEGVLKEYNSVSQIIFMEADPFLLLISSSRFRKFNLSVKGILFQPYLHFKEIAPKRCYIYKQILKNYLFLKLLFLRNKNIKRLFILNDKESVQLMNQNLKAVFFNLPDPIKEVVISDDPEKHSSTLKKFHVEKSKSNLLVFGSIDRRKNVISIVNALKLLPTDVKQRVHLVIAGKLTSDVRESSLQHIAKAKSEISISYNDDFVYGEEREILFQNCDLVVMPYINFYSASSVLGHAISYNKNIIAPNRGLLARIVRNEKLGITVDPLNVEQIKDGILELILNKDKYRYDSKSLIEEYDPVNFGKLILSD